MPNKSPTLVDKAQAAIEIAAQAVFDVRARFQSGDQSATLAELYDLLTIRPSAAPGFAFQFRREFFDLLEIPDTTLISTVLPSRLTFMNPQLPPHRHAQNPD